MTRFKVFLDAPSHSSLRQDPVSYEWQLVSSLPPSPKASVFPPSTLDEASRRISVLYRNVIFNDADQLDSGLTSDERDSEALQKSGQDPDSFLSSETSTSGREHQLVEDTISYDYSEASSIAHFPNFQFNLHTLTSLTSLQNNFRKRSESQKVALLLAALEVEGPDTIKIKRGPDAGREVSILKMILGDEDGQVCKLTAWREVAERWGGSAKNSTGVKRGDVIFIDNILATRNPSSPAQATLTASPYLKSTLEICYRTLPYAHEDGRLRPDLRLGVSDATVRKVAAVASWFERMAGLRG